MTFCRSAKPDIISGVGGRCRKDRPFLVSQVKEEKLIIGQEYRLNKAILGIHSINERRAPLTIPAGAYVVLENGPLDGTHMVDVNWEDKTVTIFTADLRERGTELPGA